MNLNRFSLLAVCAIPAVAAAQDQRQLGAHEHGVSTAEIAVEEGRLLIDIHAPGMDIVGFEYEAESAADKDAVSEAIRRLSRPEDIVTVPDAAECRLVEVLAHLHAEDGDHEGTDGHAEGDMDGHDDHAEGEDHGDHDHAGDDHGHEDGGARHSEFHARYEFACDAPDALTEIGFPFFEAFENAGEIEAQYVTGAGAGTAEIGRAGASLAFD